MRRCRFALYAPLPRHVKAHVYAGVRAERYALFALLAQQVVHAYEEVHAFGVEVNNPSQAGGEAVYGKVYAAINPLQRSHVGADTSFSPAIFAIEVSRAEGTKLQFAIYR